LATPVPLIVDLARLGAAEQLRGETDPTVLDLGSSDGPAEPVGGIRYDLRVERLGDELLVRGRVAQTLTCVCSRCAERFESEVVDSAYVAIYPVETATEYVDLTPEMREAIILALPGYPVCRSACRGLCSMCGMNLNRGRCTCKPRAVGQWAALDQLDRL
jgi:uncharacterized metal-binding protein YceD (DUF177 family)